MQVSRSDRPIDPLLFDWPDETPLLKCSVCQQCGALAFPKNKSCGACGSENVIAQTLPSEGRLWTYTIQHFMPKAPYSSSETAETFRPFAIGYVELPGALRIETRIPLDDGKPLAIGMAMALDFYVHRIEADGTQVINYQFRAL